MRRCCKPFALMLALLAGFALGACSLQLPDGTDREPWLVDKNRYQ